jgi:hypothetical protein
MNQKQIQTTREYQTILDYYGDQTAFRSNMPLMNHIDEGITVLKELEASDIAIRAFCLHPIVQNEVNIDVSGSDAYLLALEYKQRANAFLCCPKTDCINSVNLAYEQVGPMTLDCALMLIADKRQNQKDFIRYHRGTHTRSRQLDMYFNLWLAFLHIEVIRHVR